MQKKERPVFNDHVCRHKRLLYALSTGGANNTTSGLRERRCSDTEEKMDPLYNNHISDKDL